MLLYYIYCNRSSTEIVWTWYEGGGRGGYVFFNFLWAHFIGKQIPERWKKN